MILTSFIVFAWMITALFFVIPKPLSFVDYLILWMADSIFIISIRTILSLNLGWMIISEDNELFLVFLLRRSYIDVMLLLISATIIIQPLKKVWKITSAIGILVFMVLLEYVMVQYKIVTFIKFNYLCAALMYGLFLLLNYFVVFALSRGGSNEDYCIR